MMQLNDDTVFIRSSVAVSLKRKIHFEPQQLQQQQHVVMNLNVIKYNLCHERIIIIDQLISSLKLRKGDAAAANARSILSIELLRQKRRREEEEMKRLSSNNFQQTDDDKKCSSNLKWSSNRSNACIDDRNNPSDEDCNFAHKKHKRDEQLMISAEE